MRVRPHSWHLGLLGEMTSWQFLHVTAERVGLVSTFLQRPLVSQRNLVFVYLRG